MSYGLAAGLAIVIAVAVTVVVRGLAHSVQGYNLAHRVDGLAEDLAAWRLRHADRIVGLGRQMSRVERAVARAEDEAHRAARTMDELSRDVIRRMEAVEKELEIELLVAQGRIPSEHRRGPEPEW